MIKKGLIDESKLTLQVGGDERPPWIMGHFCHKNDNNKTIHSIIPKKLIGLNENPNLIDRVITTIFTFSTDIFPFFKNFTKTILILGVFDHVGVDGNVGHPCILEASLSSHSDQVIMDQI